MVADRLSNNTTTWSLRFKYFDDTQHIGQHLHHFALLFWAEDWDAAIAEKFSNRWKWVALLPPPPHNDHFS